VTPDEAHVHALLRAIGENPDREGLKDTPRRVLQMLRELCHREPFKFTVFDAEGTSEMIVQTDIPFASLCEHHMLPFMGTAAVAYIPRGKIVGLSKLARTVQWASAGLQNQERITRVIAEMIENALNPLGVGVVIRATHTCMSLRGVKAHDSWSTTSCLKGAILNEAETRAEFLALVR
jgi:GTP cyclohydrolase I